MTRGCRPRASCFVDAGLVTGEELAAEQGAEHDDAADEGEAPPAMMWNTRDCHKLLAFALEQAVNAGLEGAMRLLSK